MITLTECATFSGLGSNETLLGPVKSKRHDALLASYLLNLDRGAETVRNMIVSDLRGFLDIGALNRAADTLVVLRLFLSERLEARVHDADAAAGRDDPVISYSQPAPRRRFRNRFHAPAAIRRRGGGR